jgi:nucleoid DNA-binding protein
MLRGDIQNEVLKEICKEEGISFNQGEEAIKLTYKFISEIMASGDRENTVFKSVRVKGWGLFYCPEHRKKKLERINKNKKYKEGVNETI